jgi:hypothetical protein
MKIKVTVEMDVEVAPEQTRISVPLKKTELEDIGTGAVELAVKSAISLNRLLEHPSDDIAAVKVKKMEFFVR